MDERALATLAAISMSMAAIALGRTVTFTRVGGQDSKRVRENNRANHSMDAVFGWATQPRRNGLGASASRLRSANARTAPITPFASAQKAARRADEAVARALTDGTPDLRVNELQIVASAKHEDMESPPPEPRPAPVPRPVGLTNFNNTCFMNAVLQCVRADPAFAVLLRAALLEGRASDPSREHAVTTALVYVLDNTSGATTATSMSPFTPRSFRDVLYDKLSLGWARNDQQDAAEFLNLVILEAVPEEFSRARKRALKRHFASDIVVVDTCTTDPSHTHQRHASSPELVRMLAIPDPTTAPGGPATIADLLERDATSTVRKRCDQCDVDSVVFAERRFVAAWPDTLIVNLKRFSVRAGRSIKVSSPVRVDETLEPALLERLSMGFNGSFRYRLFGVVHHLGTTCNSGHYTADVRTGPGAGTWYKCDDSTVTTIADPRSVVFAASPTAYLAFYVKEVV